MTLIACGLNHLTAPLDLREKIVFQPQTLEQELRMLQQSVAVQEAAILSTCNRTEIYCRSESSEDVLRWLADHKRLSSQEISAHSYSYHDASAIRHIIRVASGLDSLVIGEPQIFGQIKQAFNQAQNAGTLGPELMRLFQYVFAISKHVRSQTSISAYPVSIAYMAVKLVKRMFADLTHVHAFMLGGGETIELAATYLQQQGVKHFTFINRTYAQAERLAQKFSGKCVEFSMLPSQIKQADIIITATSSPIPILGKGAIESA